MNQSIEAMIHYSKEELSTLIKYSKSLPEKARRHFYATQYLRLGFGSQRYIAKVFGCSRITITKGLRELEEIGSVELDYSWQRRSGGGRKKKLKM